MLKFAVLIVCFAVLWQEGLALKCYTCTNACEAGKTEPQECGKVRSPTQGAFCVTQRKEGETDMKLAVRKCVITNSVDQVPDCPAGMKCTHCNDKDLCNSATSTSATLVGTIAIFLFTKFVLM